MMDGEAGVDQPSVWTLYEEVRASSRLQQGDLIWFKSAASTSKYGIVVTADCDLDNKKHSRLVTLCPLITVEQAISKCLGMDLLEQKEGELVTTCRAELGMDKELSTVSGLALAKAKLREDKFSSREEKLFAMVVAQEIYEIDMDDLKLLLSRLAMSWPKAMERFQQQIISRGDILLLTKPPLINENPQLAWLRAIWQEPFLDIALRTSEADSKRGLRVARLESPYIYRLTQMLGSVFADVGLPDISRSAMIAEMTRLTGAK